MKYSNGQQYQGQWKNGLRHGLGTLTNKDGSQYHGLFNKDQVAGEGRVKMAATVVRNKKPVEQRK